MSRRAVLAVVGALGAGWWLLGGEPPPPSATLAPRAEAPADPSLADVPPNAVVPWTRLLRDEGPPSAVETGADAALDALVARPDAGWPPRGDPDRVWSAGVGLLVRAWAVAARDPVEGVRAMGRVLAGAEALRDRGDPDDAFVGLAVEAQALRELTELVDDVPGDVAVVDAALAAVVGPVARPPRLWQVSGPLCAQTASARARMTNPERVLGVRFADVGLPTWAGGLVYDPDATAADAEAWCLDAVADWPKPRWERGEVVYAPRWVDGSWDLRQYVDNPVGRQVVDELAREAPAGVTFEDTVRAALVVVTAGLVARRLDIDPLGEVPAVPVDPWNGRPLQRHAGEVWSAARAEVRRGSAPLTWTVPPGATVGVDLGLLPAP